MCTCTEPVRTGIGAVCVEYGRPKWPITMLNHTNKQIYKHPWYRKNVFIFLFLAPYARTTRYEEAFLPEGKKRPRSLRSLGLASLLPRKKRLASLARLIIRHGKQNQPAQRAVVVVSMLLLFYMKFAII